MKNLITKILDIFSKSARHLEKDKPLDEQITNAIKNNNFEITESLIYKGAHIYKFSTYPEILSLAVEKGNLEILKLLLKSNNGLTDSTLERGMNSSLGLTVTTIWHYVKILKLLLENGANIDRVQAGCVDNFYYIITKDQLFSVFDEFRDPSTIISNMEKLIKRYFDFTKLPNVNYRATDILKIIGYSHITQKELNECGAILRKLGMKQDRIKRYQMPPLSKIKKGETI